ncbi:MAG: hypothetical protein WCD47_03730 [Candidatus Sulfotelmatobacter sp.]
MSTENCTPVVALRYQKGRDFTDTIIRRLHGGDLSGPVFEYRCYLNNKELGAEHLESGHHDWVREALFKKRMRLKDENWSLTTSGNYGPDATLFN